ncbi:MAG: leucyl aminopeptidase family protein [Bacteriovoracaceae bacterium]|nr:leucyl aminopeptidase family protein [Bacteriovoracaceae bacterium]
MKLTLNGKLKNVDLKVIAASGITPAKLKHWDKSTLAAFNKVKSKKSFKAEFGQEFSFLDEKGNRIVAFGISTDKKITSEDYRKSLAKFYKMISKRYASVEVELDHFTGNLNAEQALEAMAEGLLLSSYKFENHLSKKEITELKSVNFVTKSKAATLKSVLPKVIKVTSAVAIGRDLMNEAPNILNAPAFASYVQKDAKTLKNVKIKVLNKAAIVKEKMGLFLSVNAGSAYEPRLVHLTYTPTKANTKTKHIALVGKGLTFDTGGYSLKPSASMMKMKYDMGGASTVYAAFKAAVQLNPNSKISCFLGMTDNAVGPKATMPDSIIKARNGKTVEILNTDAEGRLVLADVLDYACDFKPNVIIDAATLTGAMLMALGTEIAGMMSNSDQLSNKLLESAAAKEEYLWRLPLIPEFSRDIKSPIADLKNMGGSRFAGSSKAAAFLQEFVKEGIDWAHLDIAGVASDQSHLPYCPSTGGSGVMIRTLIDFMLNYK